MSKPQNISSNVIKLEGYGVYVTYINSRVMVCDILPSTGQSTMNKHGFIKWRRLKEPPNQEFLDLINEKFELGLKMSDFVKNLFVPVKKPKTRNVMQKLRWIIKNMREKEK